MATYFKFQPFIEDVWEGVHNFGTNQLVAFVTTNANIPLNTYRTLSQVTVASLSNTTPSPANITTATSSQTGGTYTLVLTDFVLTATGAVATFRHSGIFNDTPTSPADPLVACWDYGSDITLASGETFTMDFGSSVISST